MKACVLLLATGCTTGIGTTSAATRSTIATNGSDVTYWGESSDQSGVPAGFIRLVQGTDEGHDYSERSFSIGAHAGARKASGGAEGHLDLTVTAPAAVAGLALGASYMWGDYRRNDTHFTGSGPELRFSIAPIKMLSFDVAHAWLSGSIEGVGDQSASRNSLGATWLFFGRGVFNFGFALQRFWLDAGAASTSGWAYELIGTVW